MVIQEYIENPLLIDNKKFDMRLYVMLKSIDDIEIYLCKEGMARFCTEDYEEPTGDNLKQLFGHLTNFTLNKDNENYINK
jgi:tubulin polyglutamylase TTLL11